jgi:hypothetical protein
MTEVGCVRASKSAGSHPNSENEFHFQDGDAILTLPARHVAKAH